MTERHKNLYTEDAGIRHEEEDISPLMSASKKNLKKHSKNKLIDIIERLSKKTDAYKKYINEIKKFYR